MDNGKPVLTVVSGNVTARYRDMLITAQRGEVNYRTNLAYFEGNVCSGWSSRGARGTHRDQHPHARLVVPAGTDHDHSGVRQGNLRAPVFAKAQRITGLRDRQVSVFGSTVTTCDLPHEHYDVKARAWSSIRTIRSCSGTPSSSCSESDCSRCRDSLCRSEMSLKNPNLIPRIGNSAEEGAYMKLGYAALASKSNMTFLLTDLMQRKGVGLGIQDYYKTNGGFGSAYFYHLRSIRTSVRDTLTWDGSITRKCGAACGWTRPAISDPTATCTRRRANRWTTGSIHAQHQRGTYVARPRPVDKQRVCSARQPLPETYSTGRSSTPRTYLNASFDYTGYTSSAGTRARLVSQSLLLEERQQVRLGHVRQEAHRPERRGVRGHRASSAESSACRRCPSPRTPLASATYCRSTFLLECASATAGLRSCRSPRRTGRCWI